ncbi:LOW QUALITY PROTEIN: uncharacterized protein ACMZJ9_017691 [Mantella aurantiaca]
MSLSKQGTHTYTTRRLILNIEHPCKADEGTYVLGSYNPAIAPTALFFLTDNRDQVRLEVPNQSALGTAGKTQVHDDMRAIADPTFEDTMAVETGSSGVNFWLEWMRYSARQHNKSNCYVCGQARPHLGTVPLTIPAEGEECFLSLYTNTNTNHSACENWKQKYPILMKHSKLTDDITIYQGNYTCYSNYEGKGRFMGNFTESYDCFRYSSVSAVLTQNQTRSLGDIYWICGDRKIRPRLEGRWTGQCTLAKVIMPLHILTDENPEMRPRRKCAVPGSFDPHVYIDAIGVPRGVPDEFKARDQVKAGFESIIPMIAVNKNVDWISYFYYNQQRFINYTKEALKEIADQLGPTSSMTFQNRMALDRILAEKGGVCKMIKGTGTCCTYILDNTGPNGKVNLAIKKLEDLSKELKRNSGSQFFSQEETDGLHTK